MIREFGFKEQLVMSQGESASDDIGEILMQNIPGTNQIERATPAEDRSGTDWWATLFTGQRISVDVKVRREDWSVRGSDDLALEIWSVYEKRIAGWTRDAAKRTDFVMWFWSDTKRWCLIPFRMLYAVFSERWEEWSRLYRTAHQLTVRQNSYHSVCVFVPRRVVWDAIYERFGGKPPALPSR